MVQLPLLLLPLVPQLPLVKVPTYSLHSRVSSSSSRTHPKFL